MVNMNASDLHLSWDEKSPEHKHEEVTVIHLISQKHICHRMHALCSNVSSM
jgi:hypothetical protein